MPRIAPDLVTFVLSPDDLDTLWEVTSDRFTPYLAINARSKQDPDWYLLTWRDLIGAVAPYEPVLTFKESRARSVLVLDVAQRFGLPLKVNAPEKPSVLLDEAGKPEGIFLFDPLVHLLAVRGAKELSGVSVESVPRKGRTSRGGPVRSGGTATVEMAAATRIPHMRLEPDGATVAAGTAITVTVFANTTPEASGEQSEAIALDPKAGPMDVDVRLEVSLHLRIDGDAVRRLMLDPARESTDELTFTVTAIRATNAGDDARITAYFSHGKRPCGLVRRLLHIAARDEAATPPVPPPAHDVLSPPPPTGRLDINPALDSDLLVVIRNPSGDLKNFKVEVHTRLLPAADYTPGPEDWMFGDVTSQIVYGMFKTFEKKGLSPRQRFVQLVGAGWELWKKAPANFVKLFWTLIDQNKKFDTIAVVSEEPYIPWELMLPTRHENSLPRSRDPLGVEFTVARWTTNDMIMAPQWLPLSRSRVVAPRYADPLEHAEEEVKLVLKSVPGERIDPSDFDGLDVNLAAARASLLHFTCHGVAQLQDDDGERLIGVQAIQLEGTDQVLDSRSVRGLPSFQTFFRQRPLVVLNACEVGRPAPALNGIGGLAGSFIDLGAAGVIAPLWSVEDEVAFKVATALYEALTVKPPPTFAEVMRSIRARAYIGDESGTDSYAAYCFYGDPMARP